MSYNAGFLDGKAGRPPVIKAPYLRVQYERGYDDGKKVATIVQIRPVVSWEFAK